MAKYETKQRKILQEYLSSHLDEEFTAKSVAEDLSTQKVSISAIYRNLADMEKEKLVVQCHKEGSREIYYRYVGDSDCQQSLHLSCKFCSKTQHIPIEQTNSIKNKLADEFHFILDTPNTVFYGICENCQNSIL